MLTSTTAKPLMGRAARGWLSRDVTVYMEPMSDTEAVSALSSGSPRLPRLPLGTLGSWGPQAARVSFWSFAASRPFHAHISLESSGSWRARGT